MNKVLLRPMSRERVAYVYTTKVGWKGRCEGPDMVGADWDRAGNKAATSLCIASQRGNREVVRALVLAGLDG